MAGQNKVKGEPKLYKKLETGDVSDVVKFLYENVEESEVQIRKAAKEYIAEAIKGIEPPNRI